PPARDRTRRPRGVLVPHAAAFLGGVASSEVPANRAQSSIVNPSIVNMPNPLSYLTTELNDLRQKSLYQRLRVLEGEQLPVATFDGRRVINLSSNNYLGLTTHPKLRQAAARALEKYGAGSGAVRTIAGTMSIHLALEEKIAAFKNVEACVVFQSGFTANAGT